jgi:hypothetical protein
LLGWIFSVGLFTVNKSTFDRKPYDNELESTLSTTSVSDALSNEIFIMSYSYNYGEPRFYTKNNAKNLKNDFDVTLDFAAKATSAMPGFFDPIFR